MQLKFGRALLAAIGLACCFSGSALAVEAPEGEEIAQGIYVDDIHLGGMTYEEAQQAIDDRLAEIQKTPVTITFGGTVAEDGTVETEEMLTTTLGELGATCVNPDVIEGIESVGKRGSLLTRYKQLKDLENDSLEFDLEYELDQTVVDNYVLTNAAQFNKEMIDATITKNGDKFTVTESQIGMEVDATGTAAAIMAAGESGSLEPVSVAAVVTETHPTYTYEALSTIQDKMGDQTTYYSGSPSEGRVMNLITGTSLINGSVVLPGEIFSANAAMEPYTVERGWGYGGSYTADGKVEQSLGGGICQISSTMYNAVLDAEVTIAQRNNHSMTVGYLPIGMDAAIAGTWKDLKIQNNYDTPIYIECYAKSGRLYFAIWGQDNRPSNREVDYYSEVTKTWDEPIIYEDDPNLPLGHEELVYGGATGATSVTYKEVKVDGVVTEKTIISKDSYRASSKIIRRGTNPDLVMTENGPVHKDDLPPETSEEATTEAPSASEQPSSDAPASGQPEQPTTGQVDPEAPAPTEE